MRNVLFEAIILFLSSSLCVTARVGQDEAIPQVFDEENDIVKELEKRMKPRNLVFNNDNAEPHQFFHLHHMKTGKNRVLVLRA